MPAQLANPAKRVANRSLGTARPRFYPAADSTALKIGPAVALAANVANSLFSCFVTGLDGRASARRLASAGAVECAAAQSFNNPAALRRLSLHGVQLAVLLAFVLPGCSRPAASPVPVTGEVFFDGEVPWGAQIVLHSQDGRDVRPVGQVDMNGRYTLSTFRPQDGAPGGRYTVTLRWHKYVLDGRGYQLGPNVLPERYSDPRLSPLSVVVKPGVARLPAMNLSPAREIQIAAQPSVRVTASR